MSRGSGYVGGGGGGGGSPAPGTVVLGYGTDHNTVTFDIEADLADEDSWWGPSLVQQVMIWQPEKSGEMTLLPLQSDQSGDFDVYIWAGIVPDEANTQYPDTTADSGSFNDSQPYVVWADCTSNYGSDTIHVDRNTTYLVQAVNWGGVESPDLTMNIDRVLASLMPFGGLAEIFGEPAKPTGLDGNEESQYEYILGFDGTRYLLRPFAYPLGKEVVDLLSQMKDYEGMDRDDGFLLGWDNGQQYHRFFNPVDVVTPVVGDAASQAVSDALDGMSLVTEGNLSSLVEPIAESVVADALANSPSVIMGPADASTDFINFPSFLIYQKMLKVQPFYITTIDSVYVPHFTSEHLGSMQLGFLIERIETPGDFVQFRINTPTYDTLPYDADSADFDVEGSNGTSMTVEDNAITFVSSGWYKLTFWVIGDGNIA